MRKYCQPQAYSFTLEEESTRGPNLRTTQPVRFSLPRVTWGHQACSHLGKGRGAVKTPCKHFIFFYLNSPELLRKPVNKIPRRTG